MYCAVPKTKKLSELAFKIIGLKWLNLEAQLATYWAIGSVILLEQLKKQYVYPCVQ